MLKRTYFGELVIFRFTTYIGRAFLTISPCLFFRKIIIAQLEHRPPVGVMTKDMLMTRQRVVKDKKFTRREPGVHELQLCVRFVDYFCGTLSVFEDEHSSFHI